MLSRLQGRVRLKDRLPEAQILKCRVYATSAHIIGTYSATNRTPHTVGNHLDVQIDTPRPRGGGENCVLKASYNGDFPSPVGRPPHLNTSRRQGV